MSLVQRIRNDLNAARKARTDVELVTLLSTLAGEAERVGKDSGNRETTDAEALAVVRKFVKNATDTVSVLEKNGRDSGAIRREIEILGGYLPAAVPEAEVEAAVKEILERLAPAKPKAAMGLVIKALKEKYGDTFDGAYMSPVVKRVLEAG